MYDDTPKEWWKDMAHEELARRALAEAKLGMAQAKVKWSLQKVKAEVNYAATIVPDCFPGTLERFALDALDTLAQDILNILTVQKPNDLLSKTPIERAEPSPADDGPPTKAYPPANIDCPHCTERIELAISIRGASVFVEVTGYRPWHQS